MKKISINVLLVLLISMIVNVNYVNADITINGETWNKKCEYTSDKGQFTLYIKQGKSMIIRPENIDENNKELVIYNGKSTKKYGDWGTFAYLFSNPEERKEYIMENSIIVNDNACPAIIYEKSRSYIGRSIIIKYWYSVSDNDGTAYLRKTEGGSSSKPIDNTGNDQCNGVIDTAVRQMMNKYLGYVRVIVPIMVLFLGVLDFVKAMAASNEDQMKKAQKRFVIRLVAGVLVFLAPTIVNLIIDILNSVMVDKEACKLLSILQNNASI